MIDLYVDEYGDLVVSGGDLKLSDKLHYHRQLIINRLVTEKGEVPFLPMLGTSKEYLGQPITPQLINEVKSEILRALRYGGELTNIPIDVFAAQVDIGKIACIITILKDYGDVEPLVVAMLYDAQTGRYTTPVGDQ